MENSQGFAGRNFENDNNLTDEQMLQVIHEHQDMMNILQAYLHGIITDTDLRRLVIDKIERDNSKK